MTCPTKIVIVKSQCALITRDEVDQFLSDDHVLSGLKTVPHLFAKRNDPEWWMSVFNSCRDKLLFMCKFSESPDPHRTYPFSLVGSSKWHKVWYIEKISAFNGSDGISNPLVNGWSQWGNLSFMKITPDSVKSVIRNYALKYKSAKFFVFFPFGKLFEAGSMCPC